MCGRYTVFTEDEEMAEMKAIIQEVNHKFGGDAVATGEIFPTNVAPILTLDNNRLAPRPISWGFPRWDGKGVLINARSESALQKPMFAAPLMTRRCVIPSTGFYEWAYAAQPDLQMSFFDADLKPKSNAKTPKVKFFFRRPNEPMLYMAGMINTFTDNEGNQKDAFIILTTAATSYMAQFHNRMPVILQRSECEDWINNKAFMHEVLRREGSVLEHRIAG